MVSFLLVFSFMHILCDGLDAQIRPHKFSKTRNQKTRKWNEWNNKSLIRWFNIWYVWTFPLSIFHLNRFFFKNSLKCTTVKFWIFTTVHISKIKESGTCQKWFWKGTNSYTSLLLNLISWQMKAYFELIDISAYLHLLLLLLTLKVPLWWTLFESS